MSRRFDVIVIGSGLGGLTAGALCAKSGLRVLVLERNDTFGGAATVYRHNGLAIETSLHEIDGLDEGDPKLPLIRALGLEQGLQFVDVGDLYEVRGGPLETPFVLRRALQAESSEWQWLVLRFCIRPLRGADRSWPLWISARVQSHSEIGPRRPVGSPDHERDGETVFHSSNPTRRPRRVSPTTK
jgi:phytoene dehydrogenase-like protein